MWECDAFKFMIIYYNKKFNLSDTADLAIP